MEIRRLCTKRLIVPDVAAAAVVIGGVAWASTGGDPGLAGGVADDAAGYEVDVVTTDGLEWEVELDSEFNVLVKQIDD